MKIAVTGATGQLGQFVIAELKEKIPAKDIVAVVRSADKAASLGVEIRVATYEDLEALKAAFDGVDRLLLISGSEIGQRVPQHRNVIDAAKAAGVGRIVYTSLLRADSSTLALAPEHKETEAYLKSAGVPYTILRNGFYTENYTMALGPAIEHGGLIGSADKARFATATRVDFAAAAVAALLGDGHENKIYELAGSDVFTYEELAAEVSRQTGKTVPYVNLTTEAHAQALKDAGMPAPLAEMFAGLDIEAQKGALDGSDADFVALIGHKTTSLADAVTEALKG